MILDKYFIPLVPCHPLYFLTSALIFGICWQAELCSVSFACLLVCALLYGIYKSTNTLRHGAFLLCATFLSFCAGNFLLFTQRQQFSAWLDKHRNAVDIIVTITDITPCATKNYNFATTAQLTRVYDPCALEPSWQTTPYTVIIYTQKKPDYTVCDTIFVPTTTLSKPRNKTNHTYALKRSIGATVFCEKVEYVLLARPSWSLSRWLWTYRQNFTETLYAKMSRATASFYSLLFMGTYYPDKKESESLRSPFQIWGILHYLARSGLHLVVFIMLWNLMLLAVPCSPRTRELMLLLFSCIYFLLSWPTLSFMRAFVTYGMYKISTFTRRPSHTLYTITLVTFLFLLVNPTHLFCLDFQLSFGLTYALAWAQHNNVVWKNFLAES